MYKNILITGASSGIGASVAKRYAADKANLFLLGRDEVRLNSVAKECIELGASVVTKIVDVCKKKEMDEFFKTIQTPVDLVIAAAGVSAGTLGGPETAEQMTKVFDINIMGSINTVDFFINDMVRRKFSGHLAFVSSMAGIMGLPSSPAYSSSKAAIRILGDAMRGYLSKYGITLSVIIPGYVDTQMTRVNKYYMPFLMSSEKAAEIIYKGLNAKKGIIVFPKTIYYLMSILNLLPHQVSDWILKKLPGKSKL
jgi:short-subunit dehydrogenase